MPTRDGCNRDAGCWHQCAGGGASCPKDWILDLSGHHRHDACLLKSYVPNVGPPGLRSPCHMPLIVLFCRGPPITCTIFRGSVNDSPVPVSLEGPCLVAEVTQYCQSQGYLRAEMTEFRQSHGRLGVTWSPREYRAKRPKPQKTRVFLCTSFSLMSQKVRKSDTVISHWDSITRQHQSFWRTQSGGYLRAEMTDSRQSQRCLKKPK